MKPSASFANASSVHRGLGILELGRVHGLTIPDRLLEHRKRPRHPTDFGFRMNMRYGDVGLALREARHRGPISSIGFVMLRPTSSAPPNEASITTPSPNQSQVRTKDDRLAICMFRLTLWPVLAASISRMTG